MFTLLREDDHINGDGHIIRESKYVKTYYTLEALHYSNIYVHESGRLMQEVLKQPKIYSMYKEYREFRNETTWYGNMNRSYEMHFVFYDEEYRRIRRKYMKVFGRLYYKISEDDIEVPSHDIIRNMCFGDPINLEQEWETLGYKL